MFSKSKYHAIRVTFFLEPKCTEECKHYSRCHTFSNGTSKCMCQLACHRNLDPVCASDGKSYANLCIMERESCLRKANLVVKYEGECSECFKLQTYGKSCFEIMRKNAVNDISLILLALAVPMRNLETNRSISLEYCTYY